MWTMSPPLLLGNFVSRVGWESGSLTHWKKPSFILKNETGPWSATHSKYRLMVQGDVSVEVLRYFGHHPALQGPGVTWCLTYMKFSLSF